MLFTSIDSNCNSHSRQTSKFAIINLFLIFCTGYILKYLVTMVEIDNLAFKTHYLTQVLQIPLVFMKGKLNL